MERGGDNTEGFGKGCTLPEGANEEVFWAGSPHFFTKLCQERKDSILSEQRSKINTKLDTTFACSLLHKYGGK